MKAICSILLAGALLCQGALAQSPQPQAGENVLADRVGATGFVQLQAESFRELTPKEQARAYWLSQAAIAVHPIIYDQRSRFGLRQKHILEAIVSHPQGVEP